MDRYPGDYVLHNLPLLLLSGLGAGGSQSEPDSSRRTYTFLREGGFRLKIDIPPVQSPLAEQLLQSFRAQDASDVAWHCQSLADRNGKVFKIESVGRVYTLPPRKAPPPPYSPRLSATVGNGSPPPPLVLHSPLSPLTPSSPLYPDGITSPLWITKHQSRLPCALLTFFSLSFDPKTSSLEDNKLKSEINSIRNVLSSTNYKTKLVLVLLGEDDEIDTSEVEERCNNIRRATGLDAKSIYFLPYDASSVEVEDFVVSILSYLHPLCIEYYRDLSKHARRKRNRNVVPQPTVQPGTSSILSLQGWNVRYEFKLGVFAEFRQEMDAACRNYETAYENLFGPEVIEAIAVWSPRFHEARTLADIVALRIIRCLLWTDQGTTAVRSWISHRDRVKDLVNRKGKGTDNYGWEAWQSSWAMVMANLLSRSRYPPLNVENRETGLLPLFAQANKPLLAGDVASAWEQIHHEGYWLDMSRKCVSARRKWALQIPEEDRLSPGSSPTSVVASKSHLYDTYLALEPYREMPSDGSTGYNYAEEIVNTLDAAIGHFARRGQLRKIDILELQKGMEQISTGSWAEAIATLQPLWGRQNWRRAGWWKLVQHLGWALLDCVWSTKDHTLLIELLWELSNRVFDSRPGTNYDIRVALKALSPEESHPSVAIDAGEAVSPISPAFAFGSPTVFVGEQLECQLTLESLAHAGVPPVQLTEVKVVFEGSLKPIYLVASEGQSPEDKSSPALFVDVGLRESSSITELETKRSSAGTIASMTGYTDLTIPSCHTRIFRFHVVPREAGEISVASITLLLDDESFTLAVTSSNFEQSTPRWWEARRGVPTPRFLGQELNAFNSIDVKPKPPRLRIEAPALKQTYYTNEAIHIEFLILNEEEEDAVVSLEARMISPVEGAAQIVWVGPDSDTIPAAPVGPGILTLPSQELGTLAVSSKKPATINIVDTIMAADHEIEIVARYSLLSEPETILTKTLTFAVGVIRPFEANYDFVPRLDTDPWPSFFEAPPPHAESASALGLRHQYSVAAKICSFAREPVVIEAILLTATKIVGGAVCSTGTGIVRKQTEGPASKDDSAISVVILPDHTEVFDFNLTAQKLTLGDRHTVGIDLALEIGWRREGSDKVNTTLLEVPRLVAPMAEPRVLLTTTDAASPAPDLSARQLNFTLENPSMHFLTFNVSMEASENFAFSGPKASALSLVPISRHTLTYRILPNKKDQWINVNFKVVDVYFGQTLSVLPGGEGVKVDKKGNVLVKV